MTSTVRALALTSISPPGGAGLSHRTLRQRYGHSIPSCPEEGYHLWSEQCRGEHCPQSKDVHFDYSPVVAPLLAMSLHFSKLFSWSMLDHPLDVPRLSYPVVKFASRNLRCHKPTCRGSAG